MYEMLLFKVDLNPGNLFYRIPLNSYMILCVNVVSESKNAVTFFLFPGLTFVTLKFITNKSKFNNIMKKLFIYVLLVVAGSYGRSFAQQPGVVVSDKAGWHKIGETMVDFSRDRDEVMVIGANRFSTLKFKVTDAPIDLVSLEVHYASGDMQTVAINSNIKAPGESKTIDLNGGERDVKKIVFIYKTIPNYKDKKAHVEIWGMKTNSDKKEGETKKW